MQGLIRVCDRANEVGWGHISGERYIWEMGAADAPNVMGHIEPCLAQFAILSSVDRTYSACKVIRLGTSWRNWVSDTHRLCCWASQEIAGLMHAARASWEGLGGWQWEGARRNRSRAAHAGQRADDC